MKKKLVLLFLIALTDYCIAQKCNGIKFLSIDDKGLGCDYLVRGVQTWKDYRKGNKDSIKTTIDTIGFLKTFQELSKCIKKEGYRGLNKSVNPQLGLYTISQHGMYYIASYGKTIDSGKTSSCQINYGKDRWSDIEEAFKVGSIQLKEWPSASEKTGFSKKGCFAIPVKEYREIEYIEKINIDSRNRKKMTPIEHKKIADFESRIRMSVLLTGNENKEGWTTYPKMILDFIFIDNKWFIGVIHFDPFSHDA